MNPKPTAVFYVDGFNLYRRSLQGRSGVKWLDLYAMAVDLLPDYDILAVEYFTAQVKPHVSKDPRSASRQQAYIRALRTQERIRVHLGKFSIETRVLPRAPFEIGPEGSALTVKVLKVEEKRSDVNMAARMVADALTFRAQLLVAVTNDSDHAGQIEMLISEFGAKVGLVVPFLEAKRTSKELRALALEFVLPIKIEQLVSNQLPETLWDNFGEIRRPNTWA